jgi:hypothetical protein
MVALCFAVCPALPGEELDPTDHKASCGENDGERNARELFPRRQRIPHPPRLAEKQAAMTDIIPTRPNFAAEAAFLRSLFGPLTQEELDELRGALATLARLLTTYAPRYQPDSKQHKRLTALAIDVAKTQNLFRRERPKLPDRAA